MFSNDEARYMLNLPKKVISGNELLEQYQIQQTFPFKDQLKLLSEADEDFEFMMTVNQSGKNQLKLSLHHQEDQSHVGLLRVDYYGKHKNPEVVTDQVPEFLHPYAGQWFDYQDHHIHYFVEGYSPLVWAAPLRDMEFGQTEIENPHDITNAFYYFAREINLVTQVTIQENLI